MLKVILSFSKYHEISNLSIYHPVFELTPSFHLSEFIIYSLARIQTCHPGRWAFPHVTECKSEALLQPLVIAPCWTHFHICFNWKRRVIELIFQGINQLVSINVSRFIAGICPWLYWCVMESMMMLLQSVGALSVGGVCTWLYFCFWVKPVTNSAIIIVIISHWDHTSS